MSSQKAEASYALSHFLSRVALGLQRSPTALTRDRKLAVIDLGRDSSRSTGSSFLNANYPAIARYPYWFNSGTFRW
jgi:hypothetical protein